MKKIFYLSLLLLYIAIITIAQKDGLWSGTDEPRYVEYAINLSHGDYLPNFEDYLWNGPGYPVFLFPFILLKIPFMFIRLINSLLLLAAVYFYFLTLRLYMSERHALFFTCLFGIYPPFLRYIHYILPEILAILLVCCFVFFYCKLYQKEGMEWKYVVISSGFLGYLALSKIVFGYVILAGLLLSLVLYIFKRKINYKKSLLVYLAALIFCIPYLIYTYSVTGKIFYWGNSGGSSLYWMSTPYENELGDWIDARTMKKNAQLFQHHHETFDSLKMLSYTESDDKLKKQAIRNIMQNPSKFLRNWVANVGRLLFNYPFSYTEQKLSTYFFLIPNMFIVVIFVLCIYPAILGRRLIPYEISGLLLFGLISFGGSSLLSAYNRQFWPLVPIFFLWIAFVLSRILKIEVEQ